MAKLQQAPAFLASTVSRCPGRVELPKPLAGGSRSSAEGCAHTRAPKLVVRTSLMRTRHLAVRMAAWVLWACWQMVIKLGSAMQVLVLQPLGRLALQLPSILLAFKAKLLSTKLGRMLVGGLLSIACITLVCNTKQDDPGPADKSASEHNNQAVNVSASVSLLCDSIRLRTQLQLAPPSWIRKLFTRRSTRSQPHTAAQDATAPANATLVLANTPGTHQSREWQVLCSQELTYTILQFLESQQQAGPAGAEPVFKICSPRKAGSEGTLSIQGSPRQTMHATPAPGGDTSGAGMSRAASGQTLDTACPTSSSRCSTPATPLDQPHTTSTIEPQASTGDPPHLTTSGPASASATAESQAGEESGRSREPWHARFARVSVDRYKTALPPKSVSLAGTSPPAQSSSAGQDSPAAASVPESQQPVSQAANATSSSSSRSSQDVGCSAGDAPGPYRHPAVHGADPGTAHTVTTVRPRTGDHLMRQAARLQSPANRHQPPQLPQPPVNQQPGGQPSSQLISQSVLELLHDGLSDAVVAATSLPAAATTHQYQGSWELEQPGLGATQARLVDASCSPGQVTGRLGQLLTKPDGGDDTASTPVRGTAGSSAGPRPRPSSASIASMNFGREEDGLAGHHGSSISSPGDVGLLTAAGGVHNSGQSPSSSKELSQAPGRSQSSSTMRSAASSAYSTPLSTSVSSGLDRKQSSGVSSTPSRKASSRKGMNVEDRPLSSWDFRGILF